MLSVPDVLTAAEAELALGQLARIDFQDGRAEGVGATGQSLKQNTQAPFDHPEAQALAAEVRKAFARSPLVQIYARPMRWSQFRFARYAADDGYGLHVDNALMTTWDNAWMRADLAFTLFLSPPETYDGGELHLEAFGRAPTRVKLPAGGAVLYEASTPHRVLPVTRGERLVCVGWLQSALRGADQRDIAFDLERVGRSGLTPEAKLMLDRALGALLRRWADI